MPMYPQEFIQRLRNEIPVSQVVGARVPLKKKGREWEACCPFHQEKSPSFTVNDAKGFYHCFGCSAHGDSLKFLMEHENLTYPQAIEGLAREAGIALPTFSPQEVQKEKRRQSLQEVVAMAAKWFAEQLQLSQGQKARDYLYRRGLTHDLIEKFQIGFAPEDRFALKEYLKKNDVEEAQMLEVGLLAQPDDGRPAYDKFRSRIMFPILNSQGEAIAFGGRIIEKSEFAPKYLNSPETPLFHKGSVLYNWKNARQAMSNTQPLLIAEGYMDVVALAKYGFEAAVAPLGTALTESHLQLIWRMQDNPILCLDGDKAGQRAMWRSAELALPHLLPGKTLRFLTLPEGQDPDDLLKAKGAEAFSKLIAKARPLSEVIYRTISQRHAENTPEARAAAEAELNQLCNQIADQSVQHHFRQYFKEVAYEQRSQKKAVNSSFNRSFTKGKGKGKSFQPIEAVKPPPAPANFNAERRLHARILKLLILYPALLADQALLRSLESLEVEDAALGVIQNWLLEHYDDPTSEPIAPAVSLRDDKAVALPANIANAQTADRQEAQSALSQYFDSLKLLKIEYYIHSLQGEFDEQTLHQIQALQSEKAEILQRQYE